MDKIDKIIDGLQEPAWKGLSADPDVVGGLRAERDSLKQHIGELERSVDYFHDVAGCYYGDRHERYSAEINKGIAEIEKKKKSSLRTENADLKARLEAAEKLLARYKYDEHKGCCPEPCTAEVDKIIVENQELRKREAKLRDALEKRCKECEIDYGIDRNKDEGCPNCWIKAALDEQPCGTERKEA